MTVAMTAAMSPNPIRFDHRERSPPERRTGVLGGTGRLEPVSFEASLCL